MKWGHAETQPLFKKINYSAPADCWCGGCRVVRSSSFFKKKATKSDFYVKSFAFWMLAQENKNDYTG